MTQVSSHTLLWLDILLLELRVTNDILFSLIEWFGLAWLGGCWLLGRPIELLKASLIEMKKVVFVPAITLLGPVTKERLGLPTPGTTAKERNDMTEQGMGAPLIEMFK